MQFLTMMIRLKLACNYCVVPFFEYWSHFFQTKCVIVATKSLFMLNRHASGFVNRKITLKEQVCLSHLLKYFFGLTNYIKVNIVGHFSLFNIKKMLTSSLNFEFCYD